MTNHETAVPTETDRLHAEILEGRAQIRELRDLLRTENQRANAAIDRETTAEQAALEAQQERDRLRAVVERVRRLHDALDAETDLTSPDHEITRGAAARKIAAALDGWSPPAAVSVPPPAPRADALTAVRALHQPMQRGPFTICAHCSDWDGEWRCLGVVTDYPCPTLRALDGEPQPGGPCVAGEQQNETPEAAPCDVPNGCEDGDLCATHEEQQAHAEGEHAFCGVTCEVAMPTELMRNSLIAWAPPGGKGILAELERRAAAAPAVVAQPGKEN